ncbi:MAG TPA: hypothetical protein VGK44_07750 [Casimicrobiaceae bacterium]
MQDASKWSRGSCNNFLALARENQSNHAPVVLYPVSFDETGGLELLKKIARGRLMHRERARKIAHLHTGCGSDLRHCPELSTRYSGSFLDDLVMPPDRPHDDAKLHQHIHHGPLMCGIHIALRLAFAFRMACHWFLHVGRYYAFLGRSDAEYVEIFK